MKLAGKAWMSGASLAALSLMLAPALAATQQQKARQTRQAPAFSIGTFTPAVADPRLAAELARRGFSGGGFRFTPATTTSDRNRAVRVAVRARAATPGEATRRASGSSATQVTAITPTAYNLGVSVGWRSFALSGDVARIEGGALPGGKQAAEVGVSYARSRFSGRVEVGADRTDPTTPKAIADLDSYSVGVGGSYRIARNLDVTGGLRYKIQRDRLEPLADERRDSQAVYVGTAFRF
jgi:hypothetical protein